MGDISRGFDMGIGCILLIVLLILLPILFVCLLAFGAVIIDLIGA